MSRKSWDILGDCSKDRENLETALEEPDLPLAFFQEKGLRRIAVLGVEMCY